MGLMRGLADGGELSPRLSTGPRLLVEAPFASCAGALVEGAWAGAVRGGHGWY